MTIQTKKNRALRFVALLCLLALTVGCAACATDRTESRIDESVDSVVDVDSVDSVTLDGTGGAEANAEQSEKPGEPSVEISVDQSAKELMVPAGTKTTVEKIASYPIGEEEALQYVFEWYGPVEPEDAFLPTVPYTVQIDENEDVYVSYWWPTVTRLRDGKQWKSNLSHETYEENVFNAFAVSGGYVYMVFGHGWVEQYNMDGNLVATHTGCADRKINFVFPYVDADGQVYLKAVSEGRYFRLDGTDIPGEQVPFRVGTAETGAQRATSAPYRLFSEHGSCYVIDKTEFSEVDVNRKRSREQIYSVYHADGTLLSNFRFMELRSAEKSPCSPAYMFNYTYYATVSVDDIVFENVLYGGIVAGENGSLYLVLFLENEVELYRITPGHTEGLKLGALKEQADAA